jgi:drug/metabolite transporter (DMT)-like permease
MTLTKPTLRLKLLDLLIAIFWVYLLFDAYAQGRALPELIADLDLPNLPVVLAACAILVIAISCGTVTFWQRKNIMEDMPVLSSAVDRFFGDGAYKYFTLQLRLVSASVVSSLILAVAGLHATFRTTRDDWSYAACFGFLGFALCMFIAFLVSRRFPPALR